MARDTIYINKALIPYNFNIVLCNEDYNLQIDYNYTGHFFTVGLSKNGVTLCSGSPIMYGRRLFEDVRNAEFPAVDIVAYDSSGSYNKVTYNNLCDGVLLVLDNGDVSVVGE